MAEITWLPSALVFSAISSALLAATFLHVWHAYIRQPYVLLWSFAWWAAVGHLISGWWSVQHGGSTANWITQQLFLVTNAALMLAGCWTFTRGRRVLFTTLALAAPFLLWVALAPHLGLSFTQVELPGALLLASAYLLTSYRFLVLRREHGTHGAIFVAVLFALAAVPELDYPVLRQAPGFAPVGYALAASLAAAIALCLLVMILEQARASAQTALKDREALALRLHDLVDDLDRKVLDRTKDLEEATKEAQLANNAKSEFLARMSHEIRTPLNGVVGVVELLKKKQLDHEAEKLLGIARQSALSLLTIVNDVLDFSKIEAGKLELEAIAFSPRELCEEVAEVLAEAARGRGLELVVHLTSSLPHRLIGDPTRLRQILSNLASNAIKFTADGRVVLRASYSTGRLRCEVEDTGIGLSEEARSRVFEAFAQADSSMTRRYGGTGLGLAISQRLVDQMGGQLGLESQAGVGSTFWFEIEAEIDLEETPPAELDLALAGTTAEDEELLDTAAGSSFPGSRILLIEDDAISALVSSGLLESFDTEVELASNGIEAVESARQRRYDLILLDCEMPEMDGYAAVAEIRRDGLNQTTPVVALTAHVSPRNRQRCLDAGMNDYLAKPVTATTVEQALARWLRPAG